MADGREADCPPNLQEHIDLLPAIPGHDKAVGPKHAEDLSECRKKPGAVVVVVHSSSSAIAIAHHVRRIRHHEIDARRWERLQPGDAICVMESIDELNGEVRSEDGVHDVSLRFCPSRGHETGDGPAPKAEVCIFGGTRVAGGTETRRARAARSRRPRAAGRRRPPGARAA
jgi:cation diffusion facilitator CzcD-associated flavoprotein CzcO